jgi:acetyltransferase-like isoleucine patch superfamily enzyme
MSGRIRAIIETEGRLHGARTIAVRVTRRLARRSNARLLGWDAGVLPLVIRIGARFSTSGHLHLSAVDSIHIGDDCLFGSHVYVGDHSHGDYRDRMPSSPTSAPRDRVLRSAGPIAIGDRCWFGDNVVVLGGVSLGDGCVVGANSVVTRSLPAGTIAAGSPARPLRRWDDAAGSWVRATAERGMR